MCTELLRVVFQTRKLTRKLNSNLCVSILNHLMLLMSNHQRISYEDEGNINEWKKGTCVSQRTYILKILLNFFDYLSSKSCVDPEYIQDAKGRR